MKRKTFSARLWTVVLAAAATRVILALNSYYDPEEYAYILAVKVRGLGRFYSVMREFMTGCVDIYYLKTVYSISHNEAFIRCAYILLGLAYIPLVFMIAKKMTKSNVVAWTVALMVSFSPLHIFYSQIVRYHDFVCIFSALSIYYFYLLLTSDRPRAGYFVAYGLSTALAMMSSYYALYLAAAQGCAFLLMKGRRFEKWPVYIVSQLAGAFFFLPWLPIFIYHSQSRARVAGFGLRSVIEEFSGTGILNIADAIVNFILGDFRLIHDDGLLSRILILSALAFIGVCGLLAAVRYFKEWDEAISYLLALFVFTTILPFATRQLTGMAFHPKFLLPFSFVFYALAGYGLERAGKPVRIAVVSLGALMAVGSFYLMISFAREEPTIKSMPAKIAAKYSGGDTVVVAPSYTCGENFRDYGGEKMKVVEAARHTSKPGYMSYIPVDDNDVNKVMKAVEGRKTVWLFYCIIGREDQMGIIPSIPEDENGKIFKAISSAYRLAETEQFKTSPRADYFLSRAYRFEKE